MKKEQSFQAKNEQYIYDFASKLNGSEMQDILSMYICAMHPNYKLLPSSIQEDDDIDIACLTFVKKNAKPIYCYEIFDRRYEDIKKFKPDIIDDTHCQQVYLFNKKWDEICPQPGEKSTVEQLNEKLFSTNQRVICRVDLFNFAKQNYGNGLLPWLDDSFEF